MSTLLKRERHTHTHMHTLHIRVWENVAQCSETDLFLSSSRTGNALTYFVCISAIILTAIAGRTTCVCVCESEFVLCGYCRGKKDFTMSWILHMAWCVLPCWLAWLFQELDVWRLRLCFCVWINANFKNSFETIFFLLSTSTDGETAKEHRLIRNIYSYKTCCNQSEFVFVSNFQC